MIFRGGGGGGVWVRGCPLAANLLAFVHFYCCSHSSRGSACVPCLIILFLVDKRGHLRQHLYLSGVALCCVLEEDKCVLVLVLNQPRKTRLDITEKSLTGMFVFVLFVFVALRPMSTAMVIAGRSVHLTTLFPGQA